MHLGLSKHVFKKINVEIEEIILFLIIVLNILDAAEILPPDIDYAKKIISWSALGFLFFKAKLKKLFTGYDHKFLDITLIIGYFCFIIKNLISYAQSTLHEASPFLLPFYEALVNNATKIEITGIYIGLFLIIFVGVHYALKPIKAPSIMHLFHEDGSKPQNFKDLGKRLFTSFFIIMAFFIIVFNLTMEWLAIAIDAPLLMIGIAAYIFFVIKHKEKFSANSFLSKFGDFGSKFYTHVIEHFKYKKTVFRAINGMLVLHILTEAANFVWPFIFGIADPLYFSLLSSQHLSFFTLYQLDIVALNLFNSFLLFFSYVGNIFALLFFILTPGLLWVLIYKNKPFHPSKTMIATIITSILIFLMNPVFQIKALLNQALYGVDIIGQSALTSSIPFQTGLLIAVSIGVVSTWLMSNLKVEKIIIKYLIIGVQIFFSFYCLLYFYSVSTFYIKTLKTLFLVNKPLLLIFFGVIFIITILFYIISLITFIRDTHKHSQEHLKID